MQQIALPIGLAQNILGQQKTDEGRLYRLTTHCMRVERPEGVLLYHTLTGEVLLLSFEEEALLEALPGPVPPALETLVPRWFLRPTDADDMALADQVRDIARHLKGENGVLTEYLIFTTTACNARCFYCFEAGIRKATMSEETARAAGAYIAAHRDGRSVKLVWFGGEPLMNTRAIDDITGSLREQGVPFRSTMDSNGYLFDEALVRKAREDWKLEKVQITLDGTEAVYNARKAYVAPEGSPFQRVLRNISLLLDAGIQVKIRLNMGEDNERDLHVLIDQLAERFGGKPGFDVYVRVLIENKGIEPAGYTEEERQSLGKKAQDVWDYLFGKGLVAKKSQQEKLMSYSCRADRVNAATITPDGRLGRCETTCEDGLWGSVFSQERDEQMLRRWRERRPAEEVCRTCALYPRCVRLMKCTAHPKPCSSIERAERQIVAKRTILGAYEDWKAAGQDRQAAGSL